MSKELRIKDALKEDAGKGIIRIDPNLMKELDLNPNDVIEITHHRENRKKSEYRRIAPKNRKG